MTSQEHRLAHGELKDRVRWKFHGRRHTMDGDGRNGARALSIGTMSDWRAESCWSNRGRIEAAMWNTAKALTTCASLNLPTSCNTKEKLHQSVPDATSHVDHERKENAARWVPFIALLRQTPSLTLHRKGMSCACDPMNPSFSGQTTTNDTWVTKRTRRLWWNKRDLAESTTCVHRIEGHISIERGEKI